MDSGSLDRAAVRIAERAEANPMPARALKGASFRNILQRPESVAPRSDQPMRGNCGAHRLPPAASHPILARPHHFSSLPNRLLGNLCRARWHLYARCGPFSVPANSFYMRKSEFPSEIHRGRQDALILTLVWPGGHMALADQAIASQPSGKRAASERRRLTA